MAYHQIEHHVLESFAICLRVFELFACPPVHFNQMFRIEDQKNLLSYYQRRHH